MKNKEITKEEIAGQFLLAYAKSLGWKTKSLKKIMRRLCEEYHYDNTYSCKFLTIAYGWIWGALNKTDKYPDIAANCISGLLKLHLEEMYNVVAKENDWDKE